VKFRIAKPIDISVITELHYQASKDQPAGFLFQLGRIFLRQYYQVAFKEKFNILICAETDDGRIAGFISGSMDPEEHMRALREHWVRLGFAAAWSVLTTPKLMKAVWIRFGFLRGKAGTTTFASCEGPRIEFWGWAKDNQDSFMALEMLKTMLNVMKTFGAEKVYGEADESNVRIIKMNKLMGAEKVADLGIVDGRQRAIYVHDLTQKRAWRS